MKNQVALAILALPSKRKAKSQNKSKNKKALYIKMNPS